MNERKDVIKQSIKYGHSTAPTSKASNYHFHDHYEIYLFLSGDTTIYINETCYNPKRGDLFVYNSSDIHKSINSTGKTHERYCIHFLPNLISVYNTEQTNLLSCFHMENKIIHLANSDVEQMITHVEETIALQEQSGYGCDILIINTLISLLVKINLLFQNQTRMPELKHHTIISPLLSYISQHVAEELNLDLLASICSVEKSYLCKLFKNYTGSTIRQYIIIKRVALAKQFLTQGQTIYDACFNSGFNNYAHFARTFKKIVGVTAREYQHSDAITGRED